MAACWRPSQMLFGQHCDRCSNKCLVMRILIHCVRVVVVVSLALLVHRGHQRTLSDTATHDLKATSVASLQRFLPEVAAAGAGSPAVEGGYELLDAQGDVVGTMLQTSPEGDAVVGFSGPTNLLLVCDKDLRVAGISLLSSGDTRDHVAAVLRDEAFWQQFVGRSLVSLVDQQQPAATTASATLTSLAIAEAISRRLGGDSARSRFAQPPTLADLQTIFPAATRVEADPGEPSVSRLYDVDGVPLGWSLRTSPAADHEIGYQGPTDSVVGFDSAGRVCGLLVLTSFDNEPYVGYVRDDWSFRKLFAGRTFAELVDAPGLAEVEGVSGATMTSQAVARGIVVAATAEAARTKRGKRSLVAGVAAWAASIEGPQWGALAVIAVGLVAGFSRLRGRRFGRLIFPVVVLAYLGFGAGAVLSQAQLWGWAAAGLPRNATVLLFLTAVALLTPVTTGRNIYCAHLCAHGAAQQLLAKAIRPQRRPQLARWRRGLVAMLQRLRWLPAMLLGVAAVTTIFGLPLSLVDLEPFDAYVPAVAGSVALVLFVVSLLASCLSPMAYCRHGCPTGALLEHLRLHGRSDHLTWRDGLLGLCLLAAVAASYWPEVFTP